MPARTFALFSSLAFAAAALVGCADDSPSGSSGQFGNLRFAYSVPGVCEGCTLDREVLSGSSVKVDVFNINSNVEYQVRSTNPSVANFSFTARCRVAASAACFETVAVQTLKSGDADLEMFDEWTGTVLDRITVKVRDASSIETTVKDITPAPGGVYELKVNTDVEIISVARSADGRELIAEHGSVKGVYANADVLGPRNAISNGFGSTTTTPAVTEYATAKTAGDTTVAVEAAGIRNSLSFRVK